MNSILQDFSAANQLNMEIKKFTTIIKILEFKAEAVSTAKICETVIKLDYVTWILIKK